MPDWSKLSESELFDFVVCFGRDVRNGTLNLGRHHYALGLGHGVLQACQCGYDKLAVLELGVAEGGGLLDLCKAAGYFRDNLGLDIQVYGFDTGQGLPESQDYRDHPELWRRGDYAMGDAAVLKAQLPSYAHLVFGDIAETAEHFQETLSKQHMAFVAVDVDFYSSTMKALRLFTFAPDRYIPNLPVYFDDVTRQFSYNEWCGEKAAIAAFNASQSWRKIEAKPHFDVHGLHACHVLDHPVRRGEMTPRQLLFSRKI